MRVYFIFLLLLCFFSCEKTIQVNLPTAPASLVVDAFLGSLDREHEVRLSWSVPYFQTSGSAFVNDANVYVLDITNSTSSDPTIWLQDNNKIQFLMQSPGVYTAPIFVQVASRKYALLIERGNELVYAVADTRRNLTIDSIQITAEDLPVATEEKDKSYKAQFFAIDPLGQDYYWINWQKKDKVLNETDFFKDRLFVSDNGGNGIDGITLIPPVSTIRNLELRSGDTLTVKVSAISRETFNFFQRLSTEIQPVFGLFAKPQANVPTNLKYVNSSKTVVGFFSVALETSYSKEFQ